MYVVGYIVELAIKTYFLRTLLTKAECGNILFISKIFDVR